MKLDSPPAGLAALDYFPADYSASRDRFLRAAQRAGAECQRHEFDAEGPNGERLSCDTARLGPPQPARLLIVSSGLHGVEAYLGAALQTALLDRLENARALPAETGLLLVHALNPYGFAHSRRCDAENIDPNRNLLAPGEPYLGTPPGYGELDRLLNPTGPPRRFEFFFLKAAITLLRMGRERAMTAVAGGQHDFPHGLFFGGRAPSAVLRLLEGNYARWVGNAARVLHLDIHTGLGPWATHEVITNRPAESPMAAALREVFGEKLRAVSESQAVRYTTRGDLNSWCDSQVLENRGAALCVEFGTYSPLRVLAALRRENQARHSCSAGDPALAAAQRELREVFAPQASRWRERAFHGGWETVARALEEIGPAGRFSREIA